MRAYAARALGQLLEGNATEPLLNCLRDDEFFGARAEAATAFAVEASGQRRPPEFERVHEVSARLMRNTEETMKLIQKYCEVVPAPPRPR